MGEHKKLHAVKDEAEEAQRAAADVEAEAAGLADIANTDLERSLDLEMPADFELRVFAFQRYGVVRDTAVLKLQQAANRTLNPSKVDELQKEILIRLRMIAGIDRQWPGAARLSKEMMADAAAEEAAEAERKRAARARN